MKFMKKLILLALTILLIFSACKKEENNPPIIIDDELTDAMARDSLYFLMKQWYYWYNLMPAVVKEDYSDPYELMNAMRYKELDKWSFVADYNEFIAEMQGEFVGHGIRIGLDDELNARIAMIYSRSPLYTEGVRRGWIIKSINGYDIAQILQDGDAVAYNDALGPSTAGITNTFIFGKPDGTEVQISSTKQSFTINSVLLYDTLNLSDGKSAGHLVFESFIQPSPEELDEAFEYFKACNVNDLILDLRYNSGGYLYVAQLLSSYIAGNGLATSGSVFAILKYNDKNQQYNESFRFESTDWPLSLTRVVVISTRLTASASEAVMNGLKPYLQVISVGDTTYGKPVGMNGWSIGEKYFYWPVTFKMVNNNNEGDYFDGIPPQKIAGDDITHDFDDRNELCLKEAIQYLETGSFSTKGFTPFYRYPNFSEKPSWVTNGLTIIR
jgi:carboxyl-terminal processing protease